MRKFVRAVQRTSIISGVMLLGCSAPPPQARPAATQSASTTVLPATNPAGGVVQVATLHDVHELTPTIYCGSVPESDAEFEALARLGVKTVISVDGTKPHVEIAEKFGLRYVHLPFGYDGIPRDRELEIIRAVRDLPEPVYIHCHHGLHRGPAAAVIAAEGLAGWTPEEAVAALQAIGTSPQYPGLYASANDFTPPTNGELERVDASFPRISKLDDLSDAMVAVDQHSDNLKAAQKAGWNTPANHPDMDPATEALLLKELLREAHRPDGAARDKPQDLRDRLAAAEGLAETLETAVREKNHPAADTAMTAMQNACSACHARYRNPARDTKAAK